MYSVQRVEMMFYIGKIICVQTKKLPYQYDKWELKETKNFSRSFRKAAIAVAIIRFCGEESFPSLH